MGDLVVAARADSSTVLVPEALSHHKPGSNAWLSIGTSNSFGGLCGQESVADMDQKRTTGKVPLSGPDSSPLDPQQSQLWMPSRLSSI